MAQDEKILYTPAETMALLQEGKAVLIDVRAPEAFARAHIAGAVSLPEVFSYLAATTPLGLAELHATFADLFSRAGASRNQTVIFYADGLADRYGASCRGWWLLTYLGHPRAGVLDGGLTLWQEEGLPVDDRTAAPVPCDFEVRPRSGMMATVSEVMAALADPGVVLLDSRDRDEWEGYTSSPYGRDFAPRRGRMPGAKWIEWHRFMDPAHPRPELRPPAEIRALCAAEGIGAGDDLILTCFKGARAAHTCVALRQAGFSRLRLFLGSWNEWSRNPDLPVIGEDPAG